MLFFNANFRYIWNMRILGIDPGIGRIGWAILEKTNSEIEIVDCNCIETEKRLEVSERLLVLFKTLQKIIKKYKPDILAVEDLFFNKNTKTAFLVSQAKGVILLSAAEAKMSIFSYTPLQIKMSLTGFGRAEKSQVAFMVKKILKLKTLPKLDDTVDALAVAITQSFSNFKIK